MDILRQLYGGILVPTAVAEELSRNGCSLAADWISVQAPDHEGAVRALQVELDPGESEVIVLAEERLADLLLIDERRGWRIATSRSLTCVGLLGVLAEAKRRGVINECRPILDAMIHRAGFWIGDHLRERFLAGVNEA